MRSILRSLIRSLPRLHALLFALLLSFTIVRPAAAIDFVDFTDLWYSVGEDAWGVNFDQSYNFIFATFYIYGSDQQPTWYTAHLTKGPNDVWSGPLNRTTGTYFGAPWSNADITLAQVGTATFTPSSSYAGTLTYNVGSVNVAKVITRLTLTRIPLGGDYSGAIVSIFSNCNNPADNGTVRSFVNLKATQTAGGQLQLDFTSSGGTCRMAGAYIQDGQLYRVPNGAYTCGVAAFASTVALSQVKQTAQGIEGQWVAPISLGCVESGYFSAVLD